ncbi:MAG: polysaccharide biosynthesis C-terminal domain-containing protein [Clostridia bacterium]|nr:polysaccharide biosynthesis C-terminal domain-containing protein [Clostridia bacterium]
MENRRRFWWNLFLTASAGIFLRWVAVSFNAYVTGKLGEEGTGLLTLTMSVYGLAVTFATSGVNLAAVRLTAERIAVLCEGGGTPGEFKRCSMRIMGRCVAYSLLFSLTTGALLYFTSPVISESFLGDVRCTLSLRILALSLPPIAISSALSGYFTGIRRAYKNVIASILEQAVKITITVVMMSLALPDSMDSVSHACLAVVGGAAIAEGFSLAINIVQYFAGFRGDGCNSFRGRVRYAEGASFSSVAEVALPVAAGAYVRQGLSTTEHLYIPRGLKKSGLGQSALSVYGVLQGMVFPLLLFPSAVISSAAGLLVPEFARLKALERKSESKALAKKVFSASMTYSVGCAAVMLAFADYFAESLYNSPSAADYIRITASLIPVMYLDITVDSVLKGVGEQVYSMKVNIADSALSLVLSVLLIPHFGVAGYITSVYICESMNCTLSLLRLRRVMGVGIDVVRQFFLPAAVAVLSIFVTCALPETYAMGGGVSLRLILCIFIYLSACYALGTFGVKVLLKKNKFPNTVEINSAG